MRWCVFFLFFPRPISNHYILSTWYTAVARIFLSLSLSFEGEEDDAFFFLLRHSRFFFFCTVKKSPADTTHNFAGFWGIGTFFSEYATQHFVRSTPGCYYIVIILYIVIIYKRNVLPFDSCARRPENRNNTQIRLTPEANDKYVYELYRRLTGAQLRWVHFRGLRFEFHRTTLSK